MKKMSPVAKVSKLFGLEGELLINLYDTFPSGSDHKEPLFVFIDSLAVPLFLESFERRGKSGALVRFSDIDTENRAAELLSQELFLPSQAGEQENSFTLGDLVGFTAILDGEITGTLSGFTDSRYNPLFSVETATGEILIPAAQEFIAGIDPDKKIIEFNLPEGLLDIYQ